MTGLAIGCMWNAEELRRSICGLSSRDLFEDTKSIVPGFVDWMVVGHMAAFKEDSAKLQQLISCYPLSDTRIHVLIYNMKKRSPLVITNYTYAATTTNADTNAVLIKAKDSGTLARSIMASCAIPAVIFPVKVFRKSISKYVDGGVYAPSPVGLMIHGGYLHVGENSRFIYFLPSIGGAVSALRFLQIIYSKMDADVNKELDTIVMEFRRLGCNQERTFDNLAEAVSVYNVSSPVLMLIRPVFDPAWYRFDILNFSSKALCHIVDHEFKYHISVLTR